jgi:hypothetical protein
VIRVLQVIAQVGLALVGCACAHPSAGEKAGDGGDSDEVRLAGALADACRDPRDEREVAGCVRRVEDALDSASNSFSGLRSITHGCWTIATITDAMKRICADSARLIERDGKLLVQDNCTDEGILLRTRKAGDDETVSHYLAVTTILHSIDPTCRIGAVQWETFAIITRTDRSVVLRSDDLAGRIASIVRARLQSL